METEQDLIFGLKGVINELHSKEVRLKALSTLKNKSPFSKRLKSEIHQLKGQKRTLEYLLVVG